jgi:hypothetical protein
MVKRITGEQTQRQRRQRGASKPYSYANGEGMTGGSVTAGQGHVDAGKPGGAPKQSGTLRPPRSKPSP